MTDECRTQGCWLSRRRLPRSFKHELDTAYRELWEASKTVVKSLSRGCGEVHFEVRDAVAALEICVTKVAKLTKITKEKV